MTEVARYTCAVAAFLLLSAAPLAAAPAVGKKVPVLLDTDIGDDIDDALALALILQSPELDLRGVTTVHGDAHTRALLVCRLLQAEGRPEVPVAAGAPSRALPDYHGQMQYGLRPCFRHRPEKLSAVEFLYKELKAHPGELTLLALGPLTNVAKLMQQHPDCKPWIKRIVLMGGAVRVGYDGKPPAVAEWNIKSDVKAARAVFRAGVPLVVAPIDAAVGVELDGPQRARLFRARTPLTKQLQAHYQLWGKPTPTLFDPVAVALCIDERFFRMADLRLEVDDQGRTRAVAGKPNARVAVATRGADFLRWYVERIAPAGAAVPLPDRIRPTNQARLVPRGGFPDLVHVSEDYETDIERRWWLSGLPETKNVPPGSRRACRGVLCNDFDDLQGDPRAMYTAVIFNPVPGPPMGKHTRLAFRFWLKGSTNLRVQIYSLSKGYHRHLTLTDMPEGRWQEATVDMTQARRPDGSGGPLSQGERIDDIQFYTDAEAELRIDDIVLYDAAVPGKKRPFPRKVLFTGWFDTGRQGQEWPGEFQIVAKKPPHTGKAARSVERPLDLGKIVHLVPTIRLGLRGERPLGEITQLRFRYHLTGSGALEVALRNRTAGCVHRVTLKGLKAGEWHEATVDFSADSQPLPETGRAPRAGDRVDEIILTRWGGGEFQVDDVLLYEPGPAPKAGRPAPCP
jgi:inosine-uridine nucleoside N-ribohydrolase